MMLLGFLLVLAMSCGPRGSEGARGRLLPSNENDRLQRKLQQQEEQRNEKQQQLQAAESVGTPVEKQRMLTAVEEWKHQEAAEETAAQATPAEAMAAQEMAAQETAAQAAPAAQATPAEATPAQKMAALAAQAAQATAVAVKGKVHEVTVPKETGQAAARTNSASGIAGWAMAAGQAAAHKAVMADYVNALRPEDHVSRATKAAMEKALENAGKVNL
ncbi:unnamed protein product [Closterium sp. Naga37s-1]|nr:unnamed protein product [Closterium sp. Naga37s-1]